MEIKSRLQLFLSSTFEDTKFEQDFMLQYVFPFLREEICRPLGLDFDIVTMRWGVNGISGDTHKTSELCMKQLENSKTCSIGTAYVTFQGHRYGWCPFPSKIERTEFEQILSAAQSSENFDDAKLAHLREPYWKLDVSSEPQLYVLQPISHMPGCGAYIISEDDQIQAAQDAVFKADREKKRKDASYRYWGWGKIFESIQEVLREGSKALSEEQREKYVISVTHDEVNRGILRNVVLKTKKVILSP